MPADYETDEFVQACDAVDAVPGTRICQVSEAVTKLFANKQNSRSKIQSKVARYYQKMGILAVYAPGQDGLKVAADGSHESGQIAGKGSVVFLGHDQDQDF